MGAVVVGPVGHVWFVLLGMGGWEHTLSRWLTLTCRVACRYIEEWMNLMVAGGIIHVRAAPSSGHSDTSASGAGAGAGAGVGVGAGTSAGAGARLADPGTAPSQLHVQRFTLPEGAKALLTTSSAGSASPLAVRCLQMQALAAEGFKHMPECFAQGGGVPSIMFPGCNSVAGDLSAATPVVALVDQVPGLGEALHTAGSDAAPRILIGDDPTGRVACAFGAAFPKAIVAGWGASPEDVAAGEKAVAAAGLTNVLYSASSVDWGVEEGAGTFTHIVLVQGLGKSNDPTYALENMFTLLKPNGTASVLQLAAGASVGDTVALQPVAAAEYAASLFHALPQSRSGDAAGVGLLWSNADVQECMSDAGFSVSQRSCSWDPRLVHFVCGKPPATVGVAE